MTPSNTHACHPESRRRRGDLAHADTCTHMGLCAARAVERSFGALRLPQDDEGGVLDEELLWRLN